MVPRTVLIFLIVAFPTTLQITTIHHDKPEDSTLSKMVSTPRVPERHKRLLPYINYYLNRNQRKSERPKFTPFLDSNAIPGPFIPIVKSTLEPATEKSPNYAYIYDTLVRLKQAQDAMRSRKPQSFVPIEYFEPYKNTQGTKTIIETYTPTNIDIDSEERKKYQPVSEPDYKIYRYKPQPIDSYVTDSPDYRTQTGKVYGEKINIDRPPIPTYENKIRYQEEKPVYVVQTQKPQVNTIIDEKYVAQKIIPTETTRDYHQIQVPTEKPDNYENYEKYVPVQFITEKPNYEYYPTSTPTNIVPDMAKILKQLQSSNALPQTFTAQNMDNSVQTLVKILNGLRKQQDLEHKPIVVVENSEEVKENQEVESPVNEKAAYAPGTFTQVFPANTIDGGTPGRPGIDYPALSTIPQTDFNCKKQRYKGFFADTHTNCQVWHYCDLNGGQASFLCPNGTIFSQVALTCDWWFNVKCSSTKQQYVLNERLYKYIIPLAPKFPEDYSGPLVDRYLALKFQEMEEKMKKEKKKEDSEEEDEVEEKDDSDQLQDINLRNEQNKSEEKK